MPVNSGLAALSDHFLGATMVVYALAMLGYAAEFAFGRFGRTSGAPAVEPVMSSPSSAGAARLTASERVPAMAGAGLGAAERSGEVDGGVDGGGVDGGGQGGPGAMTDPAAALAAAMAGDSEHPPGPAGVRWIGRIAVALTALGWLAQVGSVTARGFAAHRVPWGNMYEFSSMITLVAVSTYLVMLARTRARVRWLGVFVMFPVVLYLGFAGTVLYVAVGPLVPALNSYWLKIHVAAAIVASGVFMLSAVTTVLYLLKDRWENQLAAVAAGRAGASAAMRKRGGIMMRLPTAAVLDRITYRVIGLAFPIWTFAVIAGAIWAEAAWGRYWGWDPKETWSFITWVIYAAYLHARATAGWKGNRAAAISLLGFSALFVDYYLVNLVISGLHSYAGVN